MFTFKQRSMFVLFCNLKSNIVDKKLNASISITVKTSTLVDKNVKLQALQIRLNVSYNMMEEEYVILFEKKKQTHKQSELAPL